MTATPVALAGIRRQRHAAVVLAECAMPYLAPRSFVFATSLDEASAAPYVAEVVFGPQEVVGGQGCRPAARIIGPADAAFSASSPDLTAGMQAAAAPGAAPLWLGCAGDEDATSYAREAAALLTIVESGSDGVRGFDDDLPALGDTLLLEGDRLATVTGIGYRIGHIREAYLTARLPSGEEVRGPLPSGAGGAWHPTPPAAPVSGAEAAPRPRGGRKRWA